MAQGKGVKSSNGPRSAYHLPHTEDLVEGFDRPRDGFVFVGDPLEGNQVSYYGDDDKPVRFPDRWQEPP